MGQPILNFERASMNAEKYAVAREDQRRLSFALLVRRAEARSIRLRQSSLRVAQALFELMIDDGDRPRS
jgi:hypothetical protein